MWHGSRQTVSYIDTTVYLIHLFVVFSTKYGWTALMIAARGGHNETVQTLTAAGADLNIQSKVLLATFVYCYMFTQLSLTTKDGWTALTIAARGGHNETVQTLIAAGADLNIQSVEVLLATFVYWGEPERAPHRRVERSQSIHYHIWYVYVSNLFRPRAAIYIVQQRAIYSGGRMKKLLRSPVLYTCIIIAESAKQIYLVSEHVLRDAKWQTLTAILLMLPLCLDNT